MNRLLKLACLLVVLMVFVGCDWTSGGGVESWNTRWNWVNFSGVYRGIGGGVLVTDFSATPGTESTVVRTERVCSYNPNTAAYSGVVSRRDVVSGSFAISGPGFQFTDNGDGVLNSNYDDGEGTIQYGSGAWSVAFEDPANTPPNPGALVATYEYQGQGISPGGSGVTIRSFTIHQEGETLQITDNNGSTYSGRMGSVRGTGGFDGEGLVTEGDTIIAQFTAKGVSAVGMEVEMTGTFQGVITGGGEGQTGRLSQRQMFGTWIESGGRTGDINGQTSPVNVNIP